MVRAFVLLAQVAALSVPLGRPPECDATAAGRGNTWDRLKAAPLRAHCNALARGNAALASDPPAAEVALAAADEARKLRPTAAAEVLRGRALEALARHDEALRAFHQARSLDRAAIDDPVADLALARALARTGHQGMSVAIYRTLLPRASALPAAERPRAALEAGLVLLSVGPTGLEEGVAFLKQALGEHPLRTVVELGIALAAERAGRGDDARAMPIAPRGDSARPLATPAGVVVAEVAGAETLALNALSLEGSDTAAARAAWLKYADRASSPAWAAHARSREAALGRAQVAKKQR